MSITYGFYNSINGDRKYDAIDLSSIFDGIICDGVFQNLDDQHHRFQVTAGSGMSVMVDIGRAWFNHTWTYNDAPISKSISASDIANPRWDAVVLEVNKTTRINSIVVISGTPAATPVKPVMSNTNYRFRYPLAYVKVPANASDASQFVIENAVGTSACPFVTAPLDTMNIDSLIAGWRTEWNSAKEILEAQYSRELRDIIEGYLNNETSLLYELLVTRLDSLSAKIDNQSHIWLYNAEIPSAVNDIVELSWPTLYPEYSVDFGVLRDSRPRRGDIIIGSNGYYASIIFVDIGEDSDEMNITARSLGRNIVNSMVTAIADCESKIQNRKSIWVYNGQIAFIGSPSTRINSPSVYPERNTLGKYPIAGDILIGLDGLLGRVIESNASSDYIIVSQIGSKIQDEPANFIVKFSLNANNEWTASASLDSIERAYYAGKDLSFRIEHANGNVDNLPEWSIEMDQNRHISILHCRHINVQGIDSDPNNWSISNIIVRMAINQSHQTYITVDFQEV